MEMRSDHEPMSPKPPAGVFVVRFLARAVGSSGGEMGELETLELRPEPQDHAVA